MTHQGGAAVHQCPCAVECPCTRRSLTAATDAIGAHRFNVTRYELHEQAQVLRVDYLPEGVEVEAVCREELFGRLKRFVKEPEA